MQVTSNNQMPSLSASPGRRLSMRCQPDRAASFARSQSSLDSPFLSSQSDRRASSAESKSVLCLTRPSYPTR